MQVFEEDHGMHYSHVCVLGSQTGIDLCWVQVKRDNCGKPVLPLTLTNMLTLVELGTIEWERISFHSERHIYPVGFNTRRRFSSTVDPLGSTMYTCTIVDGGSRPVFTVSPQHTSSKCCLFRLIWRLFAYLKWFGLWQITAQDDKDLIIRNDTPSGSWVELFCLVNKVRGIKKDKVTISGTDMFGLSHPIVSQLIQELPNATRCMYFLPELSFCPPKKGLETSEPISTVEIASQTPLPRTNSIGEDSPTPFQWHSNAPKGHNHFPALSAGGPDSWDGLSQVPVESIHSMRTPVYRGRDVVMHMPTRHYQHHQGVPEMSAGEDSFVGRSPAVGKSKSATTPLEPSTLVQVVATGGRSGGEPPRQKQVLVGPSMCPTDRQVRLLEVLPQLRHETENGQQHRRHSPPFGVPMNVYSQHAATSVGFDPEDHTVHSLPDSGRPHVIVPAPTCHDYPTPQFTVPNLRSAPQRFHVMASDNMGLGAYQTIKPPREVTLPLPGGLHAHWTGQLLPGRQVALCIPNFSDHHNSIQGPSSLRERQGDDHIPDPWCISSLFS